MIHEGERTREKKIKLINDLNEWERKDKIRLAKRNIILFVCIECGLQISYEPKTKSNKAERLTFDYDDYIVWFKNNPEFKTFENNYKNTNRGNWGGAKKMCMDCGSGLFDDENTNKTCLKCGSKNIITGNEICGKPCPICGTKFNEGIKLQGFEAYMAKQNELKEQWWNIYRERYNVKKPIPPNYTEEEKKEIERCESLTKCYEDDYFVINNSNNVIRFEFSDAWMSGFNCVLEWENNKDGKLTLFRRFSRELIEKNIEYEKIEQVIQLLNKYNYFDKKFYKKTFGLDGYTFGIEVKYEDKYKELAIWGIRSGILYDVGMLFLKFAGKTFKEYYEYAW